MNIKLAPTRADGNLTGSSTWASTSYFDQDSSAGAEARVFFAAFAARLKSCPDASCILQYFSQPVPPRENVELRKKSLCRTSSGSGGCGGGGTGGAISGAGSGLGFGWGGGSGRSAGRHAALARVVVHVESGALEV
jgi:uncharacterized membrane protein YgcG